MRKALVITWDGYQDQEVIYPFYRLKEEGFQVDVLAEKAATWIYGIMGTKMQATFPVDLLSDKHVNEYEFLLIPGGVKALEKIRQQRNVLDFIKKFVDSGKIVASTCHGAQLLISAKVTAGKKISGYYSIADDIQNSGAQYVREPVVVDGNIVSSPHYDFMGEWMGTAIKMSNALNNEK